MALQNDQYNFLLMEYTKRQNKARHDLELRYQQVIQAIPDIQSLDDEIATLSIDAASLALEGDNSQLSQLQSNIQNIVEQKKKLLLSHGYQPTELELTFECPDCKDTGYIDGEKCHCFQHAIIDYLYSQSNVKHILDAENFNTFSMEYYPDDYIEKSTGLTPKANMHNVLGCTHDFIEHFGDSHNNLLLYGSTGVGKTFLTHCIAKELLDQGFTVVYLTSLELFDILESYKFDHDISSGEKHTQFSYILDCDLLIIDDLGTELNNSFISSGLYQCIDSRLTRERSTIISTNLSFEDLSRRYSERIFSRITSNYTLLKIIGTDIRLKKAIE